MASLIEYAPALWSGLRVTVLVALLSIAGCAVVALVLGLMGSSRRPPARVAAGLSVELFRGASALVYLFWIYYALPLIPGMPQFTPFVSAVLVLSLVGGAYGAEIVRAGIESIPAGQVEACRALGLTRFQAATRVILPQALSQIVPGFGSLAVDVVKWTTIVSFVGVQDIFYTANVIRVITYDNFTIYGALALVYLLLCVVTSLAFRLLERALPLNRAMRAQKGASRQDRVTAAAGRTTAGRRP